MKAVRICELRKDGGAELRKIKLVAAVSLALAAAMALACASSEPETPAPAPQPQGATAAEVQAAMEQAVQQAMQV